MTTESLIAELTMQARPVARIAHARVCAEWCAVVLLCLIGGCVVSGVAEELYIRLNDPLFIGELALNVMLIVIAGCAATAFAYPDRAQAPLLKPALIACFAGYSGLVASTIMSAPALESSAHGLECFTCILSFAALPAIWMFWRLRSLASTRPMHAGAAAAMMAVATGCLGVRLVEHETAAAGLLLWHYIPLLVISAVGLLLGKKIFRW